MTEETQKNQAPKQLPSVGRIVHYTLTDGPKRGEIRAAVIVKVWNETSVNLHVFLDGANDYPEIQSWKTSIVEGGPDKAGTWFWPPRV